MQTTRRLIGYATRAELALHLALLYDRLPPLCLALGFAAHLSYLALLKPFPNIRLSSGPGLLSAGLAAGSTGLWVRHFWTTFYTGEAGGGRGAQVGEPVLLCSLQTGRHSSRRRPFLPPL